MRKYKLFIGVLVGVLIIGVLWHICKPENLTVSQISLTERDGLRLEVKSIDYKDKLVTLRLINESNGSFTYRPWCWAMDRKKGAEWYHVESITDVREIILLSSVGIDAGETKEHSFKWDLLYGTVGSGAYRIYFELLNEEGGTDYIGVEFAIDGWKELLS